MSPISYGVGASNVCRYVGVLARKQFLDLLTFISGTCDVCDSSVFGAKTRNVCLRRRLTVASVCTLLLDRDVDDCLKEMRHLVCCRLLYDTTELLFIERQTE